MAKLPALRAIVIASLIIILTNVSIVRGGDNRSHHPSHDHDRRRINQLELDNARLRLALQQCLTTRLSATVTELSGVRAGHTSLNRDLAAAHAGAIKSRISKLDQRTRTLEHEIDNLKKLLH